MNMGTKIRTILTIATCLNTALMATDLTGFSNATVDAVYRIVSIVLNFIIVALTTYYNNDYTVEGATGTKITRDMKELRDYVGEYVEEPEDADVSESEVSMDGDE